MRPLGNQWPIFWSNAVASDGRTTNSFNEVDESGLVQQLRNGDPTAIEKLYSNYSDRLYSLVYNRVGRNQNIAEDIVQETYLAALKSAGKFHGRSKPYTWLCSIAYHKITDFYRRQEREAKHRNQPQSIHATKLEQIQDDGPSTPSLVESEESRLVTEQALSSLPLDYQNVLTFKYIEDMSVSEISQIMNRSPKSVEGLLRRARQELRARLPKQTRDEDK